MDYQLETSLEQLVQEILRRLENHKEAVILEELVYSEALLNRLSQMYRVRKITLEQVSHLPHAREVAVFIPELQLGQMMAVHSGKPYDALSRAATVMLVQGIKVHVFDEHVQLKTLQVAQTNYAKMFLAALEGLEEAGLVIESAHTQVHTQTHAHVGAHDHAVQPVSVGRLFCEKDARDCVEKKMKRVLLSKDALVTPLASDYARHHHLTIERV